MITKDDIMFDVEKVGEWINEAGAKNTMWYDNITTLADKITIEQQEKMSKIADELSEIIEKTDDEDIQIRVIQLCSELTKLIKTLRGEK